MHWDGNDWTPVVGIAAANAIAGSSPADLWAVGTNGLVLHYE
jgi:hypothetical protein